MNKKIEIDKESLEWILEQLQYFENQADDIQDEAYNCRKVVEKILRKTAIKHGDKQ